MRPWIEYLTANEGACADFIDAMNEADASLSNTLNDYVMANELDQARAVAAKRSVYQEIRKKVEAERRERLSQLQYANPTHRKE